MNIIEPIVGKMSQWSHPTTTYPTPISPNPRLVGLRVSCARPTNGIRIGHSAVMSGVSAQLSRVLNIFHTYCSQESSAHFYWQNWNGDIYETVSAVKCEMAVITPWCNSLTASPSISLKVPQNLSFDPWNVIWSEQAFHQLLFCSGGAVSTKPILAIIRVVPVF